MGDAANLGVEIGELRLQRNLRGDSAERVGILEGENSGERYGATQFEAPACQFRA